MNDTSCGPIGERGEQDRTSASLGPLACVDGHWVVGDCFRPGGLWLEFRPDGIYQHARTPSDELLIPWPRIMLGIGFSLGGKHPHHGSVSPMGTIGGLPGPWQGVGRGYLHMTLRHPYEDWLAPFNRHPHRYPMTELALFEALLGRTGAAKELHRLGDAEWLNRAVGLLKRQRPRTGRAVRQVMGEILEEA
ncbi:hypothetical protein [Streptomyces sp. NRRL F-5755]|uniref:hypothetical protein n=1 Tax=Streptomyces sp. NRRL F-5755 TaxID=1519475 RepID=UPI0006AF1237|nr:hypothetical protein [Streptomyces sp. NRRL F-5755]